MTPSARCGCRRPRGPGLSKPAGVIMGEWADGRNGAACELNPGGPGACNPGGCGNGGGTGNGGSGGEAIALGALGVWVGTWAGL